MDPHVVVEGAQHVTEPSLWAVVWGVITTVLAGGATFVAGLTKWTIHREMERNDERHEHTEERADKLEEALTQLTRTVVTGPSSRRTRDSATARSTDRAAWCSPR